MKFTILVLLALTLSGCGRLDRFFAGLTPLERATIEKETRIGVAAELAKVQFPGMMIIGGGGNGSATNPFDAVGLESFMRINDRLNKENTK